MRIGILGGSFDPVHRGHIALAEAAVSRLHLDRVLLVVAASQPLKVDGHVASAEDRYAMVRLAVRMHPEIEASDLELRRGPPSYTIDTLREVRAGLAPGHELFLILGADALADLPRWREGEQIPSLAALVGCRRPGAPEPAGVEEVLEGEYPEVSSSEVRRRLAAGLSVEEYLAPDVAAYIASRGLYRGPAA